MSQVRDVRMRSTSEARTSSRPLWLRAGAMVALVLAVALQAVSVTHELRTSHDLPREGDSHECVFCAHLHLPAVAAQLHGIPLPEIHDLIYIGCGERAASPARASSSARSPPVCR